MSDCSGRYLMDASAGKKKPRSLGVSLTGAGGASTFGARARLKDRAQGPAQICRVHLVNLPAPLVVSRRRHLVHASVCWAPSSLLFSPLLSSPLPSSPLLFLLPSSPVPPPASTRPPTGYDAAAQFSALIVQLQQSRRRPETSHLTTLHGLCGRRPKIARGGVHRCLPPHPCCQS